MSQPFVNESQNYNQLKPNIKNKTQNQFLNNKYTKIYYRIIYVWDNMKRKTTEEFIEQSKKLYPGKYSYNSTHYIKILF